MACLTAVRLEIRDRSLVCGQNAEPRPWRKVAQAPVGLQDGHWAGQSAYVEECLRGGCRHGVIMRLSPQRAKSGIVIAVLCGFAYICGSMPQVGRSFWGAFFYGETAGWLNWGAWV